MENNEISSTIILHELLLHDVPLHELLLRDTMLYELLLHVT